MTSDGVMRKCEKSQAGDGCCLARRHGDDGLIVAHQARRVNVNWLVQRCKMFAGALPESDQNKADTGGVTAVRIIS